MRPNKRKKKILQSEELFAPDLKQIADLERQIFSAENEYLGMYRWLLNSIVNAMTLSLLRGLPGYNLGWMQIHLLNYKFTRYMLSWFYPSHLIRDFKVASIISENSSQFSTITSKLRDVLNDIYTSPDSHFDFLTSAGTQLEVILRDIRPYLPGKLVNKHIETIKTLSQSYEIISPSVISLPVNKIYSEIRNVLFFIHDTISSNKHAVGMSSLLSFLQQHSVLYFTNRYTTERLFNNLLTRSLPQSLLLPPNPVISEELKNSKNANELRKYELNLIEHKLLIQRRVLWRKTYISAILLILYLIGIWLQYFPAEILGTPIVGCIISFLSMAYDYANILFTHFMPDDFSKKRVLIQKEAFANTAYFYIRTIETYSLVNVQVFIFSESFDAFNNLPVMSKNELRKDIFSFLEQNYPDNFLFDKQSVYVRKNYNPRDAELNKLKSDIARLVKNHENTREILMFFEKLLAGKTTITSITRERNDQADIMYIVFEFADLSFLSNVLALRQTFALSEASNFNEFNEPQVSQVLFEKGNCIHVKLTLNNQNVESSKNYYTILKRIKPQQATSLVNIIPASQASTFSHDADPTNIRRNYGQKLKPQDPKGKGKASQISLSGNQATMFASKIRWENGRYKYKEGQEESTRIYQQRMSNGIIAYIYADISDDIKISKKINLASIREKYQAEAAKGNCVTRPGQTGLVAGVDKYKFLGEFGDIRIRMKRIVEESGKILFVPVEIINKAHKPQNLKRLGCH